MPTKIKVKTDSEQKKIRKEEEATQMSKRTGISPASLIFKLVLKHAKVSAWATSLQNTRMGFLFFSLSLLTFLAICGITERMKIYKHYWKKREILKMVSIFER